MEAWQNQRMKRIFRFSAFNRSCDPAFVDSVGQAMARSLRFKSNFKFHFQNSWLDRAIQCFSISRVLFILTLPSSRAYWECFYIWIKFYSSLKNRLAFNTFSVLWVWATACLLRLELENLDSTHLYPLIELSAGC